ncbi:hypothetical protein [Burkholderia pseudomallei]|uniref:hypothetical protein n=1 Tax=Burkholderia pseudomallei TaxID=28450 RepID=UPI00100AC766|nr:hypothetical protein [Burkholderia pseudomallei]
MNSKFSRFTVSSDRLDRRPAASSGGSSGSGGPSYARRDEVNVTEFRINLDPDNGGLPLVDMSHTNLGFRDVVALLRDGELGSTELPPKQYD